MLRIFAKIVVYGGYTIGFLFFLPFMLVGGLAVAPIAIWAACVHYLDSGEWRWF